MKFQYNPHLLYKYMWVKVVVLKYHQILFSESNMKPCTLHNKISISNKALRSINNKICGNTHTHKFDNITSFLHSNLNCIFDFLTPVSLLFNFLLFNLSTFSKIQNPYCHEDEYKKLR